MVSTGVETVRLCLGSSVVQYNDMHNVLKYVYYVQDIHTLI